MTLVKIRLPLLIGPVLMMLVMTMLMGVRLGRVGVLMRVRLVAARMGMLMMRIVVRVLVRMRNLFVGVRMRMICHRKQPLSWLWRFDATDIPLVGGRRKT